ncbi:GNAT family N-acetyltransferase [Roseateles amylovorans]|jgi:ElaA protein|uniref:GNAT family N-acetyltransferase n=1 Tax=Roseateles amylovorans TaxID=2978473 RepID=A0ABY6AWX8_9BURK|nr:GNAT family N-acetyltransferase [Roseateles amylovorans]UXH77192.1 GNAT family N-acetyltransferase [Roseateles amylovorans]
MSALHWTCEHFDELTTASLYQLMRLRSEVFVVEQRCVYLDPDGLDDRVWHLCGRTDDGALHAYARLLPPSLGEGAARIGRVITAPAARGGGLGRTLMQQALAACGRLWPSSAIELGAQAHLRDFYGSFGFTPISEVYDEDGIPHIDMRREST